MKRKHSRKQIVVDASMQARIVVAISLPMLACLAFAVAGEFVYQRGLLRGWWQGDGTIFGMPESRLGMLLLFVSCATIQVVAALLASQRVAGVSYHIRRILNEYREGRHDARVRLRNGDFQHRLGDDVNEFLDWLDERPDGGPSARTVGTPEASRPSDASRSGATREEAR